MEYQLGGPGASSVLSPTRFSYAKGGSFANPKPSAASAQVKAINGLGKESVEHSAEDDFWN